MIDLYAPIPDMVREWLRNTLQVDKNGAIPSSGMYNLYATHCPSPENVTVGKLLLYLRSMFPNIEINKTFD